jgi:uncharacterized membrane protein YbhN (UPF0104 family)
MFPNPAARLQLAASSMTGYARLRVFVRAVIGAALLAWLIRRTGFRPGVLQEPASSLAAAGAASLILILGQALSAWRWQLLLGADPPRWLDLFRIYLIGQFVGLFLPTSIGGDMVRIAAVSRVRSVGRTTSSVLLDRGLGLGALLVYLLVGVVLVPAHAAEWSDRLQLRAPPLWVLGITAAGLILVLVVAFVQPIFSRIRGFTRETLSSLHDTLGREPRRLTGALILSFLVQAAYIAAWGVLALGLGLTLPVGFLLFAVPFVSLAMMLPVTIAGFGVREGVWTLLLAPLGVPGATGVALGLLYFGAFSVVGAAGGLWLALRGTGLPRPENARAQARPAATCE